LSDPFENVFRGDDRTDYLHRQTGLIPGNEEHLEPDIPLKHQSPEHRQKPLNFITGGRSITISSNSRQMANQMDRQYAESINGVLLMPLNKSVIAELVTRVTFIILWGCQLNFYAVPRVLRALPAVSVSAATLFAD
jgi:hypothetical protein